MPTINYRKVRIPLGMPLEGFLYCINWINKPWLLWVASFPSWSPALYKWRRGLSSSIHSYSLLLHCDYHVTSCFKFLLSWLSLHEGPYSWTMLQKKAFILKLLCQIIFITSTGRAMKTLSLALTTTSYQTSVYSAFQRCSNAALQTWR